MAYRDAFGSPGSRGVSSFHFKGAVPQCDMDHEHCEEEPTMIEDKGYIYCANHGLERRAYGHRVRKLRPHELNRIRRGEQVKSY